MRRVLLAVLVALGVAGPAVAQQVQVQLLPPKLQAGQTGRMTLFFVDGKTRGAPQFDVPEGVDIEFDGSYQRYETSGFDRRMIYAYRYRITALEEGAYTLGGWTFDLGRAGTVTAGTARLQVVPREDLQVDRLEIKAGFDTDTAWEGQVVVYDYELVAGVPTMGIDWRLPAFDGLRVTDTGQPQSREYVIDDPKGGLITITGGSIPLIATGTGDRTQPGALASVRVPVGQPGFMGMRNYRAERVVGPEAKLTVKPLADAPADFSGLVGDFRFRTVVDTRTPKVGQSVNWSLEVVGDGNLDGWTPPDLDDPQGLTVYDNDGRIQATIQDGSYVASGLFQRVLVPSRPGPVELPDYKVVTFSPKQGRYITHDLELGRLTVQAGSDGEVDVQSFSVDGPVADGGGTIDLRSPYTWGLSVAPRLVPALPLMSVLAAFPALFALFLAGVGRVRVWWSERTPVDERPPTAAERLAQLPEERMDRLAALDGVLRQALADRTATTVTQLVRDDALESLPYELRARAREVWRALDRARFASGASASLEDRVRELVADIEALPAEGATDA